MYAIRHGIVEGVRFAFTWEGLATAFALVYLGCSLVTRWKNSR